MAVHYGSIAKKVVVFVGIAVLVSLLFNLIGHPVDWVIAVYIVIVQALTFAAFESFHLNS